MTSYNYDMLSRNLGGFLASRLINIPQNIKEKVQEIRIRVNRPVAICCADDTFYLTGNGGLSNVPIGTATIAVSHREITEIFNNLCSYSVYSKQSEIINGFITIKGGHRAGICGTAVGESNRIINIRDISSINIRIASEHKDCSKAITERISDVDKGILLCGSPCSGKTTILRDLARILSTEHNRKVSLIDSRSEIAGTYKGVFQMDIGLSDVLDGYSKKDGFSHSLRCLSPDIIICDELGSEEDILSVENALNSGVTVIASAHCSSKKELLRKENLRKLLKVGGFGYVAFLDSRKNAGKVLQVVNCNEFLP